MAYYSPTFLHHEIQFRDEVRILTETMQDIMFQAAWPVNIPEGFPREILHFAVILGPLKSYLHDIQLFTIIPFTPAHEYVRHIEMVDLVILVQGHPEGLPMVDSVSTDFILMLGYEEFRRQCRQMFLEVVDPAIHRQDIDLREQFAGFLYHGQVTAVRKPLVAHRTDNLPVRKGDYPDVVLNLVLMPRKDVHDQFT